MSASRIKLDFCFDILQEPQLNSAYGTVYNMNTKPKGLFFLVNNFNFEEARKRNRSYEDRDGTQTDAKALTELFKQFGFKVEQRDDLTAEAMQKAFKEQVQRCAIDPYSCFCAAVLSHGKDGGVVGTDGEFLSTKDIMDMFHGDKCPKLIGKPKVFFIQACQGENKDKGCEVPDGWTINDALLDEMDEGKNQTDGPGERRSGSTDFFLAVATVSGEP
ncbi:caspase-8-like [Haliotis cracherodii]|uniref:caspase-8-like n=1 Tax=Haliotis cracherodii TaxID=6455 RepID=UPI0039E87BF6